jgi:hypothetical protein
LHFSSFLSFFFLKISFLLTFFCLFASVADPHHVDADPDPACHFDPDPDQDPACHCDADPDPVSTFHFDTVSYPIPDQK